MILIVIVSVILTLNVIMTAAPEPEAEVAQPATESSPPAEVKPHQRPVARSVALAMERTFKDLI